MYFWLDIIGAQRIVLQFSKAILLSAGINFFRVISFRLMTSPVLAAWSATRLITDNL